VRGSCPLDCPATLACGGCVAGSAGAADKTADIEAISGRSAADLAIGYPSGILTGTIPVSDSKVGLTLPDVVNTVGQNRIAVNFLWTLVTGYLAMFMQAGFAAVETGLLPRVSYSMRQRHSLQQPCATRNVAISLACWRPASPWNRARGADRETPFRAPHHAF
jgi:hypothetical protein